MDPQHAIQLQQMYGHLSNLPPEVFKVFVQSLQQAPPIAQAQASLPQGGQVSMNASMSNQSKNSDWGVNDSGHKEKGKDH